MLNLNYNLLIVYGDRFQYVFNPVRAETVYLETFKLLLCNCLGVNANE